MPISAEVEGALTRKLGPLPVWAWGGLGLAGVGLLVALRGRKSGSGASSTLGPGTSLIDLGAGGSGGVAPTGGGGSLPSLPPLPPIPPAPIPPGLPTIPPILPSPFPTPTPGATNPPPSVEPPSWATWAAGLPFDPFSGTFGNPDTFIPAAQGMFSQITDIGNADPGSPGDVAFIANNYYGGDIAKAGQGIVNVQSSQQAASDYTAGKITGNVTDANGNVTVASIAAALASGAAHYV